MNENEIGTIDENSVRSFVDQVELIAFMPESQESQPIFVEAGRYRDLRQAEERGLVISSMGCDWRVECDDYGAFVLLVNEWNHEAVVRELAKFEAENPASEPPRPAETLERTPAASLFVCGWLMSALFIAQSTGPAWLKDAGMASSEAITRHGEWWRTLTALSLHADISHFAANLATGLIFAASVLPLLGVGWTWTLILASGAVGNLLNAWSYHNQPHFSIGASTAVFGALGILTACQTLDAFRSTRRVRFWEVILPLGAGVALLAYLGAGGGHTDLLAHFWGFIAGGSFGAAATMLHLRKRTPIFGQRILAAIAPGALMLAWFFAQPH